MNVSKAVDELVDNKKPIKEAKGTKVSLKPKHITELMKIAGSLISDFDTDDMTLSTIEEISGDLATAKGMDYEDDGGDGTWDMDQFEDEVMRKVTNALGKASRSFKKIFREELSKITI